MINLINAETDCRLDLHQISSLLLNMEKDADEMQRIGASLPCIEKNVKQLKAILNLLKMECTEV